MYNTLVIARYKEDVSLWLDKIIRSFFHRVILYDKGGCTPPQGKTLEQWNEWLHDNNIIVTVLPNIGRESHTYLAHVIDEHTNGTRQDGCTFFCQGDIRDHVHVDMQLFFRVVMTSALQQGFSECCTVNCHDGPIESFRLLEWPKGTPNLPNRHNLNYQQWFERFMRIPFPKRDEFRWVIGAVFAIRNTNMYLRPLSFYEELMQEIAHGKHTAPEVGHFFERSWRYVFI